MPCNPLITDPFVFPRPIDNRPGLPRIAYRIGRYADFLEAMTRSIDAAPELAAWTHRGADDPGIALLQGAAVLGDILSFYQEHYANEAYLRTAAWRESVAELVRLTGYRLAPGIGGRATLAFEVRGDGPLTLRAGFPVKADLQDLPDPADFQTDAELLAWPHLGRFNLYRPRAYASTLAAGATRFELHSVGNASDSASLTAFELKPGDQLLLMPAEPGWTSSGSSLTAQQAPQQVKVKTVTRLLGRVIVETDAPLQANWNQPVAAWRVGRSFRHFGHNAPARTITSKKSGSEIVGAFESGTGFQRHLYPHDCTNTSASIALPADLLPLDAEVSDLLPGMRVVVQVRVARSGVASPVPLAVVRKVLAVRSATFGFGNLNGASSLLTLDQPLIRHAMSGSPWSDVRDFLIQEVTSPALSLKPVSTPSSSAFANGSNALFFYGSATQARALAGRRLYLSHSDGRSVELTCTSSPSSFPTPTPDVARPWPLNFDRPPTPFTRADFDEAEPRVTVYGNLVDASQGKAEHEAVLGNGDHRQQWQTFPLPKAPLTYFLSAGAVPPQTPELEIWVEGRLWNRVDSFYGHGPDEPLYIVREDAEGRSFVQFGDGETGARLPSGLKNVVARYRSGVGARGPIKPGATPTAGERPAGFDKVALAGIVSGGADPEPGDKAREAAPGKVQSLGRLVSIRDYESETLAVPGVVRAAAAWDLHESVPAVILRVLLAAGREAEFAAVQATLAHAQRCRGPDRFPLVVQQARPRHVFLDLSYARDPRHRQEDVEAALRTSLGLAAVVADERSGLFGLHARRLGEPEYASRIEGRAQNVAGVLWCRVTAFGLFAPGLDAAATLPAAPRPLAQVLPCSPHELLQLALPHLTLTPVAEPAAGECP
ncbi:putative baseplate assembly protein [compost metagenome]